jgi:hypothetical protein
MKKLVIGTSLAVAMLAASPSFAAVHHSRLSAQQPYATDAYAAADSTAGRPAIVVNGVYAGWDPDPAIRLQLMRDPSVLAP